MTPSLKDPYYVRIVLPSEELRPFVTAYNITSFNLAEPICDYLFPEWTNLRFVYRGVAEAGTCLEDLQPVTSPIAHGPTSRPTLLRISNARVFAVGITPLGWTRFFNAPASDFADRYPAMEKLLGPGSLALEAALAEADDLDQQSELADAWFGTLLKSHPSPAILGDVEKLHTLLNDPDIMTVEEICATMGYSTARLTRLCRRAFGFAPKLLLRRQRFLRMLGTLHFRPYEEWRDFLDPLYVDQSHFIRDFHRFMNMSPSHYLALPRAIQRPAVSERAKLFGQPTQGLHLPDGSPATGSNIAPVR